MLVADACMLHRKLVEIPTVMQVRRPYQTRYPSSRDVATLPHMIRIHGYTTMYARCAGGDMTISGDNRE